MKVNDYVRNNKGEIGKIICYIDEPTDYYCNCYVTTLKTSFTGAYITEYDNNIKSNPNILNLLEPMDLLYIDISPDNCGGIVVPRIPETLDELERYIKKIKSGEYILKYVVTHEQLENNMYEVGE